MTHGTCTPDCPNSILIIPSRLRKIRSQLLVNAVACGNRAIVLLRLVILPKSSAVKNAFWKPLSLNAFNAARNPPKRLTENIVEQITAAYSAPNSNDGGASESTKNDFGYPKALPFRSCPPRAIQIRQNLDAQKILPANVRAASSLGKSIHERLTKNSVARCATTL